MKENKTIEFKEDWRDDYLKAVTAFANSDGGEIYIGADDQGNPVTLKNTKRLLDELPNKIHSKLGIIASVDTTELNGEEVVKIKVSPSDVPVSYNGKFYVRTGSTVQEINGPELTHFLLTKRNQRWDSLLSEVGIEEVDMDIIKIFTELAKPRLPDISEDDPVEKILNNLDLCEKGKLRNAGVLLFCKNPQSKLVVSGARVGRFKTEIDILDTVIADGNLFEQLDIIFNAIKKNINVKYKISERLTREDVWDYPLDAIREATINALIHRDYLDNAESQIKIFDEKILFWNPGLLPEGMTVEMLKTNHQSRPRNKLLAKTFYFAGLIEQWGSGTKRIVELCRLQGMPEPEFKEEEGGLLLTLYKDIYTEDQLKEIGLNERQVKAVLYVKKNRKITNKEYQEINNCFRNTASNDLNILVSKDILRPTGKRGRGSYYVIAH